MLGILEQQGWHIVGNALPIQVAVKFGDAPIGDAHLHKSMHEYFLVLRGHIKLAVQDETLTLTEGDILVVEPGEPHQMLARSDDARYLLLMPRAVPDDKAVL